MGGLVYSAFAFSFSYRSLGRIDRAYATGVSGGNGWQRLFEGTRLQFWFDHRPEKGYMVVMGSSEDGESGRTSVDDAMRENRQGDLEAAWVKDEGVMWRTKELDVEK